MARLALLQAAALAGAAALRLSCSPLPLGCYDDSKGGHPVTVSMGDSSTTTATSCVNACAASGYQLAGLTAHVSPSPDVFCYCGSSIAAGAVAAPPSSCNIACFSNSSQTCGGNYFTSLYNATCDGPIPVPLAPGPACSQPEVQGLPFCDTSLSYAERIADLISRLEPEEYGPLLTARNSPAIPRLGVRRRRRRRKTRNQLPQPPANSLINARLQNLVA